MKPGLNVYCQYPYLYMSDYGQNKGNLGCFSSLIDFGEWINQAVIWHYQ